MTDNKRKPLKPPKNTQLPFFAYGIFKPGQIAHSKIKTHVKKTENAEIAYGMRHRDGVPILIDRESKYGKTQGVILTFRDGQEEETYGLISKTLLKNLYEWKTIEIDGRPVNVVFGVNPDYGSDHIEDNYERVCFDAKNDPLFNEALDLIERNLNSRNSTRSIEGFFELQMNYMLLWSAIDRFSSLRYNKESLTENHIKFAGLTDFKQGIKKFKDKYHDPVYSTDDLKIHKFNADDPIETLFYYYTLRCNVVHRGKGIVTDYGMLKTATKELLELFRNILETSFEES